MGDRRVLEVSGLTEGRVDGLGTTEEGKRVILHNVNETNHLCLAQNRDFINLF